MLTDKQIEEMAKMYIKDYIDRDVKIEVFNTFKKGAKAARDHYHSIYKDEIPGQIALTAALQHERDINELAIKQNEIMRNGIDEILKHEHSHGLGLFFQIVSRRCKKQCEELDKEDS